MSLESTITWLYGIDGTLVLLFYVPQILAVARDKSGAQSISLKTWSYWCLSQVICIAYMVIVAKDYFLTTFSAGHLVAMVTIVLLTMYKRLQLKRATT